MIWIFPNKLILKKSFKTALSTVTPPYHHHPHQHHTMVPNDGHHGFHQRSAAANHFWSTATSSASSSPTSLTSSRFVSAVADVLAQQQDQCMMQHKGKFQSKSMSISHFHHIIKIRNIIKNLIEKFFFFFLRFFNF